MTERDEPSLEALRREFEYRIRTAVTYGLGRGKTGDTADLDVAGWIDREIGAAMASLTVSQALRAVKAEVWDEAIAAVAAWWQTPEDERGVIVNPYGTHPADRLLDDIQKGDDNDARSA